MSGSGSGLEKIMDPDPVCPERLDPVCSERLDPDPVYPVTWIRSISDQILVIFANKMNLSFWSPKIESSSEMARLLLVSAVDAHTMAMKIMEPTTNTAKIDKNQISFMQRYTQTIKTDITPSESAKVAANKNCAFACQLFPTYL